MAVALLAWWVTHSSIFDARSINVRGNRQLTRSQVLQLAGVGPSFNLMWFSPGSMEVRLERSPWISSAHVSRALPSTLTIEIGERTAIAVVMGERLYLVAADRTVLGPGATASVLPRIHGPAGSFGIGTRLPLPSPGLAVLVAMPPSLRSQVSMVTVGDGRPLVVELRDGTRAIYGDATEASAKAVALQAVVRWARSHGTDAERIDVRVPSRPALLPTGTIVPVT